LNNLGHQERTTPENSGRYRRRLSSPYNLRGGHFAPRLLYFWYYLMCRVQAASPRQNLPPNFGALNVMGVILVGPSVLLSVTINHYISFFGVFGQTSVLSDISNNRSQVSIYIFFFVALFFCFGSVAYFFGGRYEKIMNEFALFNVAYNNKRIVMPYLFITMPWIILVLAISGISLIFEINEYENSLLYGIVGIAIFYVVTESIFRLWWRAWCKIKTAKAEG